MSIIKGRIVTTPDQLCPFYGECFPPFEAFKTVPAMLLIIAKSSTQIGQEVKIAFPALYPKLRKSSSR